MKVEVFMTLRITMSKDVAVQCGYSSGIQQCM